MFLNNLSISANVSLFVIIVMNHISDNITSCSLLTKQ